MLTDYKKSCKPIIDLALFKENSFNKALVTGVNLILGIVQYEINMLDYDTKINEDENTRLHYSLETRGIILYA